MLGTAIAVFAICTAVTVQAYSNDSSYSSHYRYLEEPLSDYESEYIGDFRQISFTSLKERAYEADWRDITSRTIAIDTINFGEIFDRLVTPAGLITQFALSVELEIIQVLGWIGAGVAWTFLLGVTDGALNTFLQGLGFLLSPQALATTVIRALWNRFLEIVSRLSASIVLLGLPETIEGVTSVTLTDVGDFLFSPLFAPLILGRTLFIAGFFLVSMPLLFFLASSVWPSIRPTTVRANPRFSDDGVYYGDGYDYTNYEYNSESFARYQAEEAIPQQLEDAVINIISNLVK